MGHPRRCPRIEREPDRGGRARVREEVGLVLSAERVAQIHEDDHGGWSYWTVVVDVDEPFPLPTGINWETAEVRWVREDELPGLALLKPFRATMVRLGFLSFC